MRTIPLLLAAVLVGCTGSHAAPSDAPGCPIATCASDQYCVIQVRNGAPGDPASGCNALPAACTGSAATCACVQATAGSACGCSDTPTGPRLICGHG